MRIPGIWRSSPSFPKFILAGFALVTLPLILALTYSAIAIDKLSEHSEQAVHQAEELAHDSHLLVEQNMEMEHSARVYLILGDRSLLDGYFRAHQQFRNIIDDLDHLPLNIAQKQLLLQLDTNEMAIYREMKTIEPANQAPDFSALFRLSQQFLEQSDAPVEYEISTMQSMARRSRNVVTGLLATLIPLVIILVLSFSWLTTRPLRQILDAIRDIGQGDLSKPVHIHGSAEFQQIGAQLDWMRQRLQALEAQKTVFLQQISHELKTPLTSIREGADLLHEQVLGELNERQGQVTQILFQNSLELQKRIEDLLNYSAIQTGKTALPRQTFSLQSVVEHVQHEHALTLMNRGIDLKLSLPDIHLEGDEQKIRIIMDNLLSNAIKYSPPGGTISVSGSIEDQQWLLLAVADQGPGIDPADREHIFDPFYQGHIRPSEPSHIRGTGLGLSISLEYARLHGGDLMVENNPTQGSRFILRLPLQQSRPQP